MEAQVLREGPWPPWPLPWLRPEGWVLSYFSDHLPHSNGLVMVCTDLKRPQELQIGWKDATASSKMTLLLSCGGHTCDRATGQWTSGRHLPRASAKELELVGHLGSDMD